MKTDDQWRSSLVVWLIVGPVLLPVAYVLSVGPVVWLFDHAYIGGTFAGNVFNVIYAPIDFVTAHWEPARKCLAWYLGLWGS